MRVTLWGNLGEEMKKMKSIHDDPYVVVITSMSAKKYNNRLYLSSSSSTMILDDPSIPTIKDFTAAIGEVSAEKIIQQNGTIAALLEWGRDRIKEPATFICNVKITNVRTKAGWNYLSCNGGKCKKGVTRRNGKFWCDGCEKAAEYPLPRYRLELDVTDGTGEAVVVLFDETAEGLVKCTAKSLLDIEDDSADTVTVLPNAIKNVICTRHTFEIKAHTYYQNGSFEGFTCSAILQAEDIPADEVGTPKATVKQDVLTSPTNCTPLKVNEGKHKSLNLEDSDYDSTDYTDCSGAMHKKKKRYIVE